MLVFSACTGSLARRGDAGQRLQSAAGITRQENFLSGDNCRDDHHTRSAHFRFRSGHPNPAGPDTMTDHAVRFLASFALCSFEAEKTAVFYPDSF